MWPGRPPAASRMASVARSTRSQEPRSSAGSRFPWTPRSAPTRSQPSPSGNPPVEADDVPARRRHRLEEVRRAGAEVDRRDREPAEDPLRVRRDELLVVLDRQRADPAVEELDRVGARLDLGADVAEERLAEALHQLVPDLRRAEHAGLRLRELAGRLALDQIARNSERAAAEADERPVRHQRLADDPDGFEDERHRVLRLGHAEGADVVQRLDRPVDHRPDVLDELDVDAHPDDREHDVGEHHGRVHAVRLDRLERHLRAELRSPADLEEVVALPDRAVAGQGAARLAHEPDGRPLDGFALRGADEQRLGRLCSRRHGAPVYG